MSHYKSYAAYKESVADWLGKVPEHWKTSALKWKAKRFAGGTPDKANLEYWIDGAIPWLASGEVNQKLITQPTTYITEQAHRNSSAKWIPSGALVMALAGQGKTRGTVAQLAIDSTCNQSMAAIVPHGIRARFLYWWLESNYSNLRGLSGGDVRDGLNLEVLGQISCPLPTDAEQAAISTHLDRETARIDALVEKKTRFIELLREKRQAFISHAVTKGLDPNVPMKGSGVEWLGQVPAHWNVKQIRYFAEVLRGKFTHRPRNDPALYGGDFPFIQTGDISGASKLILKYKQTLNEKGVAVSKEFPRGTLVMAIAANIGDVAILDFPAYFPDSIVGLVPKKETNLLFLFYLMQAMRQEMLSTATISTQMNINIERIVELLAAQPSMREQEEIVLYIENEAKRIDSLIEKTERSIELLNERRSALITAAVTGQIDLRGTTVVAASQTELRKTA